MQLPPFPLQSVVQSQWKTQHGQYAWRHLVPEPEGVAALQPRVRPHRFRCPPRLLLNGKNHCSFGDEDPQTKKTKNASERSSSAYGGRDGSLCPEARSHRKGALLSWCRAEQQGLCRLGADVVRLVGSPVGPSGTFSMFRQDPHKNLVPARVFSLRQGMRLCPQPPSVSPGYDPSARSTCW